MSYKHTITINPIPEGMDDTAEDNRRIILRDLVTRMEAHMQASALLCARSGGYNVQVILADKGEREPLGFTNVKGWTFIFPVNSYFRNPTMDLFEQFFHKNCTLDQYLTYSCELVE